jgi:hypothetical protein
MAITQQMVLIRLEDIAPFAEARQLARHARALANAARHADHRAALGELAGTASAVCALVAEALRAGEPRGELTRFRDAELCLMDVRALAYDRYAEGALTQSEFDEVMSESARCLREIGASSVSARRRARRKIDEVG